MAIYEPGERVLFIEEGYPLTGKRGTVESIQGSLVTVRFDHDDSCSTHRASYFSPVPESPSSTPPACGAV